MKMAALLCLCVFSIALSSQKTNTPTTEALRSFASQDGVFRFKYSSLLIRCTEEKEEEGNASSWFPDDCRPFTPICDDSWSWDNNTLVCFAYPKARFKESATFEGGAFSVAEIRQAATKKACMNLSSESRSLAVDPGGRIAKIHGVQFRAFEFDGVATGHSLDAHIFRTFHRNKCYELSIRMATTSPGLFDPGTIKPFTRQDWNEVYGRLKQAVDSFRFLK